MSKMNCWEFRLCGREVGGDRAEVSGVCPAASDPRLDGVHGGLNSGRACWMVAGTLCNGRLQGSFAQKMKNCLGCDFYNMVRGEESGNFKMSGVLMQMLEVAA